MELDVKSRFETGGVSLTLYDATVQILEPVLAGRDGYVWIYRHFAHPAVSWWRATVQLGPQDTPKERLVRNVSFDLQSPVEEFLSEIDDFNEGINLVYSANPMPDTLNLDKILFAPNGHKALIENGARLTFQLPHRYEWAELDIYFEEDVGPILERLRKLPAPA